MLTGPQVGRRGNTKMRQRIHRTFFYVNLTIVRRARGIEAQNCRTVQINAVQSLFTKYKTLSRKKSFTLQHGITHFGPKRRD